MEHIFLQFFYKANFVSTFVRKVQMIETNIQTSVKSRNRSLESNPESGSLSINERGNVASLSDFIPKYFINT